MFERGIGTFPLELSNFYNKLCWKSENIMIIGGNKGENVTIIQKKKINAVKPITIKESTVKEMAVNRMKMCVQLKGIFWKRKITAIILEKLF